MRCRRTRKDGHYILRCLIYMHHQHSSKGEITHHLLHTVPVHQSVWISAVSLVVLVVSYYKLAAETQTQRAHHIMSLFTILCHVMHREAAHLACRNNSLLKGLCLWPHLFRRPQQAWPPSPMPPLPPRGSKVKFRRWFKLIFFGPAN